MNNTEMIGKLNKWKVQFDEDPEFIKYNEVFDISMKILESFIDFIYPDLDDYIDVITAELFDKIVENNIKFLKGMPIEPDQIINALLYSYENNGKLSEKFLNQTKIKKEDELSYIKSIINSKTSFFEMIKEGSKEYKAIVRDIITNEEYDIIDVNIAFSIRYIKNSAKFIYFMATLIDYDGISRLDNLLLIKKNNNDINQLIDLYKNKKVTPLQAWLLSYSLSEGKEK